MWVGSHGFVEAGCFTVVGYVLVISLLSCIRPSIISSLVSSFLLSMFIGGIVDIIALFVVCFCSFCMFVIPSFVLFTRMSLVPIIISVFRCLVWGCLLHILWGVCLWIFFPGHLFSTMIVFFSIWAMVFVLLESADWLLLVALTCGGPWMEQCGLFSAAGGVKTYISVTEICDIMFKFSPQ